MRQKTENIATSVELQLQLRTELGNSRTLALQSRPELKSHINHYYGYKQFMKIAQNIALAQNSTILKCFHDILHNCNSD